MKKYLFIILILFLILAACDETKEVKENNTENTEIVNNEPDEEVEREPEVEEETSIEEMVSVIDYDEELLFGEYTINNIKTEIENDELKLMFEWINQSGKDDIPFTAVGYFDVMQGEEILEEISGAFDPTTNSDVLRRTDNGIISPVTLIYQIKNDEPIEVSFGATHEIDDTKESITIDY